MIRTLVSLAAIGALAACSSGPRQSIPDRVINRVLAGAPGQAQPSKIVAREIEFARAAREQGQWTAFRAFAAPTAMLHGRDGPIIADPWLAAQDDPDAPVQWAPRAIWMSCNGELAVSTGRFRDPQGIVGNFITVWERQADGTYLWTYDLGSPDNPQPPPPQDDTQEGDIVVTAMDAVAGNIADCPRRAAAVPPPPAFSIAEDFSQGGEVSSDGTLRWRWEHRGPGERRFVVNYFYQGEWQTGLDQDMPAGEPQSNAG